jgi:hypothetical protein
MRLPERRLISLALGALLALLVLPTAAGAATTFGSRLKDQPANSGECQMLGPCTIVSFIHPSDPEGDPYSGGAPVGGVITKFRIYAYTEAPTLVTFRVAEISRPNPADQTMATARATGTGPTVTIMPTEEPAIREFDGRLPVKPGEHLAIDGSDVHATYNNSGNKFSYIFTPQLADGAALDASLEPTGELLVQGDIEPDVDGDGFGDETQDQCPSQASTHGECDRVPPAIKGIEIANGRASYSLSEAAAVRIQLEKKHPGRRIGRKCVKQTKRNRHHRRCPRFTRVGAAFDGPGNAGANSVPLPGGKRLGPGTYRLTLTLTDAAGNKTTKRVTFKIAKRKRRRH